MKIMGHDSSLTDGKNLDAVCLHGNDVIDILKASFDEKESAFDDREPVLLKNIGRDDGV